jgi:hypothetical protein
MQPDRTLRAHVIAPSDGGFHSTLVYARCFKALVWVLEDQEPAAAALAAAVIAL